MEFSPYLEAGLIAAAERRIRSDEGERPSGSLAAMEQAVQGIMPAVGGCVVKEWVEVQAPQYPAEKVTCEGGIQAKYVWQREAVSITRHGTISYRRAYYGCACGQGQSPLAVELAIEPGPMSAALKTVAALVGVQEAYATRSATVAQRRPVEWSPNSIRAACQDVEERLLTEEACLLKASQDLQHPTATQRGQVPRERVYRSVDGFQAPFEDGWQN